MPVPSTIADLDIVASNNSPQGSDSIGVSLDDYLRSHAAIIKQQSVANDVNSTSTNTLSNKTLDSTCNISGASGQPFSFRNKLINGGFNINQRAYVSGAAVGANLYGLDRWKMVASADTFTFSTTANKTTVTIPAGKVLQQVIEGLNLQTGTYTLSWEGTAQGKIGAGSLSTSGVTGSITGGTDTTIEFGPGTVSNAQLEFGTIATPFENRPIQVELAMCQRYYLAMVGIGLGGYCLAGGTCISNYVFPTPMRIAPAIAWTSFGTQLNATSPAFYGTTATATDPGANAIATGQLYIYGGAATVSAEL